jgi:hypothetical protein
MKIDFKNIDLSNKEVCPLCSKKNEECICNDEYYCKCNLKSKFCKWPSSECPCPICLDLIKNCKCNKE